MADHHDILTAAQRILAERGETTFTPDDIVRALPDLNPSTIRTHVVSRCCVNAPKNHPHKWDYFRRVQRGRYEVMPRYRKTSASPPMAREVSPAYGVVPLAERRAVLHGVIARSGRWYTAQCVELPIVTQGRTLDETVANLRDAVQLHLEGERLDVLNLSPVLTLHFAFETTAFRVATT
jgi:predicted RNase H-like HicB family nuclease